MTDDTKIKALHAAYLAATGFDLPLTMQRLYTWEPWLAAGLTPRDVTDLVAHHKRLAREHRPARSLVFRNLIGNVEYAQEDLASARAQRRYQPPDPARASVLQATGRQDETAKRRDGETAKPLSALTPKLTGDPTAAAQAFAEFLKLRGS